MFGLFKKLKPVSAYESIMKVFAAGGCPCCDTPTDCLLMGPEGGMSVNVMCDKCGARYNYTDMSAFGGPLVVNWTHGPQKNIWGNKTQSKFPSDKRVAEVSKLLERA